MTETSNYLSQDGTIQSRPFAVTGISFTGRFSVEGESVSVIKVHIAISTCLVTRAIQMEVLKSLATESFLMAFRRVIARRGMCSTVYSDNANTFKRAGKEINQMLNIIQDLIVKDFIDTNDQVEIHSGASSVVGWIVTRLI